MSSTSSAAERLLSLFRRLRKLAFEQNPLQDNSITMPQLTLLEWVAETPGCGIQEIADGLDLSAPTVSVGIRRLEEAGLLERRPDPEDGRAVQLFLTIQGRRLHERARAFRRKKMQSLLEGLTPAERRTLLDLLERAVVSAEKREKDHREVT